LTKSINSIEEERLEEQLITISVNSDIDKEVKNLKMAFSTVMNAIRTFKIPNIITVKGIIQRNVRHVVKEKGIILSEMFQHRDGSDLYYKAVVGIFRISSSGEIYCFDKYLDINKTGKYKLTIIQ